MNLHRSIGKPDWEKIRAERRNSLQQFAASSHGWVTLGNLTTLLGFGIVIWGLVEISQADYWLGLILLIVGRLLDVVDGWAADQTRTKSPLGETLDASFDKLGTLLTVIVLYTSHVAPLWALLLLVVPHFVISIIALHYLMRGKRLHPSRLGKLSMAFAWVSLLGLLLARAGNLSGDSIIVTMTYITIGVSFSMGVRTAIGYLSGSQKLK